MKYKSDTPVLGFAAYSGTGKTSLLTRILPALKQKNIRTAVIKHAHHTFDIDHKGKDSYELRKAGASQMLIGSEKRWALIVENDRDTRTTLADFIEQLDHDKLDLVLVEGFKPAMIPKIELVRPSMGMKPFYPEDDTIIAVATDDELTVKTELPILDLNQPEQVVEFIVEHFLHVSGADAHTGT